MAFEIPNPHPNHARHLTVGVLLTALSLTVAFHFLLAVAPYGFSFAIFVAALVVGMHVVAVLAGRGGNAWSYLFLVPVALVMIAESLYASPVVRVLAFPVVALALALFGYWRTSAPVAFRELPGLVPKGFFVGSFLPIQGLSEFFSGLHFGGRWVRALIGAALALPFIIIIGALFVSADKLFGQAVFDILDVRKFPEILGKLVRDWIVLLALVGAGWTLVVRNLSPRRPEYRERQAKADAAVAGTFLGLLNALFAVFIAFQAVYFFGGESYIQSHGLTYAEYARSGFFQLLAVSGIVFAVVWGFYRFTEMKPRIVRAMNAMLILQTGVVIASAIRRLMLYIDAFGLTVSRFWAMAVILLIAAVLLAAFVGAVMRWKYAPLANALAVGILLAVSTSFLVNVEGLVVRTNVERFLSGRSARLDMVYLDRLSGSSDAIPALVSLYSRTGPGQVLDDTAFGSFVSRARLAWDLRKRGDELALLVASDWRRAVVADYRAIAAISALPPTEALTLEYDEEVRVANGSFVGSASTTPSTRIEQLIRDRGYDPNVAIPERYEGDINLDGWNLDRLEGRLPQAVTGGLVLRENRLTSLDGLPKTIGGSLDISSNDITSLAGMPEAIGGSLDLSRNPLESLDGLPKTIGGALYLYDIPARSIPAGLSIKRTIGVNSWQVELFRDARAKGYGVYVAEGRGN